MEQHLLDGEHMVADGSYIPANISRASGIDVEENVQFSMHSYLDDLDAERSEQAGYKKPPEKTMAQKRTTSTTDPECGYIDHGTKRGVGYLTEMTVECKHGIVTGVDTFPANEKESLIILRHLQQMRDIGVGYRRIALDRGYDTGAVHRGLEILGISGYIPRIDFPNSPDKYGFTYEPKKDCFICPEGEALHFHRLNCNKSTGKISGAARYAMMPAFHVPGVKPALIKPAGGGSWPAAAIRRSFAAMNGLGQMNTFP